MWRRLVPILVVSAAIAGCTPTARQSPLWYMCKLPGADPNSLQRRAQACGQMIRAGLASGDDLGLAYRLHAAALRLSGDPADALKDIGRALALNGRDGAAYGERGLDELALGRSDAAAGDFQTEVRLDPTSAEAFDHLSAIDLARNDPASALREADRAIELKPDRADTWMQRGLAFVAKHRFDMAMADFAQAAKLDPTETTALDAAGDAATAKGDAKAASDAYVQAEGVDMDRQDYRSARVEADKVLALTPKDPDALNASCWTRAIGDVDLGAAMADCQTSLTIRPGSAEVLDSRAFVEFRLGRFKDAIQDYNAALAKDPKLTSSLYMRGVSRLRAGDAAGRSDISAARNADASIAGQYASYGVTPEGQ